MELTPYMNEAIGRIVKDAILSSRRNTKELRFLTQAAKMQRAAAQKRLQADAAGNPVPPFLIASVATRCNLHCAGCYARANHTCMDEAAKAELSAARWGELFGEAEALGVSFALLAGGEPLARPDVLDKAAASGLLCPVFTNGTLLTPEMLARFDRNRNLIPIVSLEGDRNQTDLRRGLGVFDAVRRATEEMNRLGLFFGVSVTVTKENLKTVTDDAFISSLRENGCRLLFFVEYVPIDGNMELAPGEAERLLLEKRLIELRGNFQGILFLSFPGDEKALGGCLAAGRGFFHINAFGDVEPCPFSPYSDVNLRTGSLRDALSSALFRQIRESGLDAQEHIGGCALFARRVEVAGLLQTGFPNPYREKRKAKKYSDQINIKPDNTYQPI